MGLFSARKKSKPTTILQAQKAGAGAGPTTATNIVPSQPRSSQKPIHAALELPEVLQRTFDFVDEYTLHYTVILVCHQWFWMNQHRIVRKVNWFESSKTKRFEKVVSRLSRATHMVWHPVSEDWTSKLVQTLAENHSRQLQEQEQGLHGLLGQDAYFQPTTPTTHHGILKKRNPLQISRILKDMDVTGTMRMFQRLLPSLGSLTSLRVQFPGYEVLDIDSVLLASPRLVFLRLESKIKFLLQVAGTSSGEDTAEAATSSLRPPLRTFIVENAIVTQPCLEHLLAVSPRLKDLQLRNLYHQRLILVPQIEQWSWLMTKLSAYGISLLSVHFSIHGQPTPEKEVYEKFMMVAPRSQEWVLRLTDLTPALTHCLWQLPNVVTHLELIQSYTGYRYDGNELHRYLCASPNLLHLKALHAVTLIERMDIHDRWTDPAAVQARSSGIWACRNLRTLHITCHASGADTIQERKGRSRILFGYISRVLPRLEDLVIVDHSAHRLSFTLELEGGFCLLARLSQLAYLRIGDFDRKMVFRAADLRWIVPSGHINGGRIERSYLYRTWGDLLAEEANTTARRKNIRQEDMTKDVELWKSLENLGLLLDVKKMVDEMEANPGVYTGGMRTLRDLAIYKSLSSRPTKPEKEYLRLANDNFELKRERWRDEVAGLGGSLVANYRAKIE
ncbi:hypothetical protein BG015_010091 [Linnemannia schmuckeri]|uniref:F-box domain-containing protein n=1 Tax=Linnemannia schmuckeri TaxID=64567 RepID=A0A9P5RXZ9_9FUNG|nr:hypothetical protein BG015_010091 [Linnemannia schmuckeri]